MSKGKEDAIKPRESHIHSLVRLGPEATTWTLTAAARLGNAQARKPASVMSPHCIPEDCETPSRPEMFSNGTGRHPARHIYNSNLHHQPCTHNSGVFLLVTVALRSISKPSLKRSASNSTVDLTQERPGTYRTTPSALSKAPALR